jgi:hypothetical protein
MALALGKGRGTRMAVDVKMERVTLELARGTPGTWVYQETKRNLAEQTFPTIYLKKGRLPADPPRFIHVTVEYVSKGV